MTVKDWIARLSDRALRNVSRARRDLTWHWRKREILGQLRSPARPESLPESGGAVILFLAHDAGVAEDFRGKCAAARALADQGHRVLVSRCFELFERCPVIDCFDPTASATRAERRNICLRCAGESLRATETYGLETLDLRAFLNAETLAAARQAVAAAPDDLLDFEYEGVLFGKLSALDLVLGRKIHKLHNVSPECRTVWLKYVRDSVLSYLLVGRVLDEFKVTHFVHAAEYANFVAGRLAAERRNVPTVSLTMANHRNIDRRRFLVYHGSWSEHSSRAKDDWREWRTLPLSPQRIGEIGEDLFVRLGGHGSHVYSPAKSVGNEQSLATTAPPTQRKLLVAFTSSLDELVACQAINEARSVSIPARPQPFQTQIEWLQALSKYVAASKHLELVVRVHPREGKNRRDSVVSEHLPELREAFASPLAHCRFIWPEDPLSSYDLAEQADCALISWSNIGMELARLGVPVVASFNRAELSSPEGDVIDRAATPAEYFARIEVALGRELTLERLRLAYRWYNMANLEPAIDFSDVLPLGSTADWPPRVKPARAADLARVVVEGANVRRLNLARARAAVASGAEDHEREALVRELRRLVHFFMTGERAVNSAALDDCLLHVEGSGVTYAFGEVEYRRQSRLIARLAPLCSTHAAYGASTYGPRKKPLLSGAA